MSEGEGSLNGFRAAAFYYYKTQPQPITAGKPASYLALLRNFRQLAGILNVQYKPPAFLATADTRRPVIGNIAPRQKEEDRMEKWKFLKSPPPKKPLVLIESHQVHAGRRRGKE